MVAAGPLLVRVDADSAMGAGHFMRCLALGQYWRSVGGKLIFFTHCEMDGLLQRARAEGAEIVHPASQAGSSAEARELCEFAKEYGVQWLALDGFHFSAEYQQALSQCGGRLLVIDDNGHSGRYTADLVVDQNLTASLDQYSRHAPQTKLLLGTSYALLRREFAVAQKPKTVSRSVEKLLITMGGTDPSNASGKILEALQAIQYAGTVHLIAGISNAHKAPLQAQLACFAGAEYIEDCPNMAEPMRWADAAISAGGTTCWELAAMHTPMFLLIMAENHAPTVRALQEKKCAAGIGWVHRTSLEEAGSALREFIAHPEKRAELVRNASQLTDGLGAKRVVESMLQNSHGS